MKAPIKGDFAPTTSLTDGLRSSPTPLWRMDSLCTSAAELWVKDDGKTHPEYGGNKIRKLSRILPAIKEKGARRLLTFGAAGSHHVYATAIFGAKQGLEVRAGITAQEWTPHAEEMLRASLSSPAELVPLSGSAGTTLRGLRKLAGGVFRDGDAWVLPGGSSPTGVQSYVDAVSELAGQLGPGEDPDVIVVALGSGGTAAGILAGVLREGLKTRVVGVPVLPVWRASRRVALALAGRATHRDRGFPEPGRLSGLFSVDPSFSGGAYGRPTPEGERASEVARAQGLKLDPTYTAKAFAKALSLVENARPRSSGPVRVLYWHTLSEAPPRAMASGRLPPELGALLRGR